MRLVMLCVAGLIGALPCLAWAAIDKAAPILYSKTALVIKRSTPPVPAVLPWQGKDAPPPQADAPELTLDVEVRDARVMYNQQGWFNLNSPAQTSAVLMVFGKPTVAPILGSTQYAPLDILMIDQEGKIIEIAPSIKLSELRETINPPKAILAFMFMKGGACAALSIKPGDEVQYPLFKKPPMVLSVPTATPAVTPPVTSDTKQPTAIASPYTDVIMQDTPPVRRSKSNSGRKKTGATPADGLLPTLPDLPPDDEVAQPVILQQGFNTRK